MKNIFGKCLTFLKKNVYYALLIVSILALGTMITVYTVSSNQVNNIADKVEDALGDTDLPVENPEDPKDVVTEPIVFAMPVANATIGMEFSGDTLVHCLTLNRSQTHKGLDFKAEAGTAVAAVYDGVVESVKTDVLKGTIVTIKINEELTTVYQSLGETVKVKAGDIVKKGDILGMVSDTALGEILEGAHLHLEVYQKGVAVNPADYLLLDNK